MTPPRAPPPGGGCCYSQPESLGEGEEAAALGHLPSALGREEAGELGRRASGPPHPGGASVPRPWSHGCLLQVKENGSNQADCS